MKKKHKKLSLSRETVIWLTKVAGGDESGITCFPCDIPVGSHPFGEAAGPLERDHGNICA